MRFSHASFGPEVLKQWLHVRLHRVPVTWIQRMPRCRKGARGASRNAFPSREETEIYHHLDGNLPLHEPHPRIPLLLGGEAHQVRPAAGGEVRGEIYP